jgi:hypothetical protein
MSLDLRVTQGGNGQILAVKVDEVEIEYSELRLPWLGSWKRWWALRGFWGRRLP